MNAISQTSVKDIPHGQSQIDPIVSGSDPTAFVQCLPDGTARINLMVENIHCGGCVRKIETALNAREETINARVNLTTRRLTIMWKGGVDLGRRYVAELAKLGFPAQAFDPEKLNSEDQKQERALLTAMGIAGFAAANVMLLSVAVWSGHFSNMGDATRSMLHWFSALIALPGIAWAGLPFFKSALSALKHKRTNMDVPISVGVLLATAMSLFETYTHGEHVYFESALMLLFFLLVGRYLDRRTRAKARKAAERLLAMSRVQVTLLKPDGTVQSVPADWIQVGDRVQVGQGERIGVDALIDAGRSDIDMSMISGETASETVGPGDRVFAGTLNLSGSLTLTVDRIGDDTLLAEIIRLIETAEQKRGRFTGLADKITRLYTPVVHILALAAFVLWWCLLGLSWQPALMIAVAVLIITCPCALGLAVPAVQVTAGTRLMKQGILLKSPTALERLAAVDTVIFDKTGTLTRNIPTLLPGGYKPEELALAVSLAQHSSHPLRKGLVTAANDLSPAEHIPADEIVEYSGNGLSWIDKKGREVRLGRAAWCGIEDFTLPERQSVGPEIWLHQADRGPVLFRFSDHCRREAAEVISALRRDEYEVHILSGDMRGAVSPVAEQLGIKNWKADCRPDEKVAYIEQLSASGRKVVMIGDGLNDAPALASAHASISLSTASDISQTSADAILQGDHLYGVPGLLKISKDAQSLVKQNFALALAYNALAIPFAMAGFVTPLIAALAMSLSSILVTGNAMRLSWISTGFKKQDQNQ